MMEMEFFFKLTPCPHNKREREREREREDEKIQFFTEFTPSCCGSTFKCYTSSGG
jgi:hypothetical protein